MFIDPPAQPDIIYVPVYAPAVVYCQRPAYSYSFVSFSTGFPCGSWLDLDCDWQRRWGGWCYRPGWTWNRWCDNIACERDRVVRFRCDPDDRGFSRGVRGWGGGSSVVW